MQIVDKGVKNLIFDLGGVIIDLSVAKTVQGFERLTGLSPEEIRRAYQTQPVFFNYEKGQISSEEFRNGLRSLFSIDSSNEELDHCWNAMLVHLPKHKLELLEKLKADFNVFLLSNTNDIHLEYVNRHMVDPIAPGRMLDSFFHKSFYSHHVRMRKPDAEIFEFVLNENNLDPAETIFMDDMTANIQGAASLGIRTIQIEHPDNVLTVFKNYV